LYRFETLEEVWESVAEYDIDILIINPSFVISDPEGFILKKTSFHSVYWIGLLYSFFERGIVNLFDSFIQVNDSRKTIEHIIEKSFSRRAHKICGQMSEQLSSRELDVLKHVALGLSNKEIADDLNISFHTVVSHRKNITRKTGIKSQAGLAVYAISNKIITVDDYPGIP
jgi:DNA-binding NarL/FixJ family response regulator